MRRACLALLASFLLTQSVSSLTVDVGAYGREFCFSRDAHEGDGVELRYAVHQPRGSPIRVRVLPVQGEAQMRALYDEGGDRTAGLAEFVAPHTGTFKICLSAPVEAGYTTSVSIAMLVRDADVQLEDALRRSDIHGAHDAAHAIVGLVQQILYRQDAFREAVWRHDEAMYESGVAAVRAASVVAALVVFFSAMQVVYVRHLLTDKARRRTKSFRRNV